MNEPRDQIGQRLDDCGCCEGLTALTPGVISNRPGLPAVAYRVGTHSDFLLSMLARLSSAALPALADLKTRDSDDFAIAMLDAWATTADVLTYYQERIANECGLRTATERLSLIELARLIGYRLKPGVAASAFLAFTIDPPVAVAGGPDTALHSTPGPTGRAVIDVGLKVASVPGPDEKPQTFETVETIEARADWNAMRPRRSMAQSIGLGASTVWLAGAAIDLEPGGFVLIVASDSGTTKAVPRRIAAVMSDAASGRTRVDLEPATHTPGPVATASPLGVWALRVAASPFGHNAPLKPAYDSDGHIQDPSAWTEWALDGSASAVLPLDGPREVPTASWVVVDRPHESDAGARRLIVSTASAVRTTSLARYGLTGRVAELTLGEDWRFDGETDFGIVRDTVVRAGAEPLAPAERPVTEAVFGSELVLDSQFEGLVKGRRLVVTGLTTATGERVSEVITLQGTELTSDGLTKLLLSPPLAFSYQRETVAVNANVAKATHGESVSEILGSGDATATYQEFELKQPPLTHVAAATPSGTESTLEVRVDDIRWHETPTLYGRGPGDRVFATRTADDGTVTVQFGDGATGARLPTGQNNLRASYRKGIGIEAMVDARQLSQLMTRPLGVKDVVNPLPAEGAEDPERLADARRNAPLTVRTLDRAVSLLDYEDFARGFAGIAKALATWTWDGRSRSVWLTVAGPDGAAIADGGATHEALVDALAGAGDPHVVFQVKTYEPAFFSVEGSLVVDPDHLPDTVLASARAALRKAFDFDAREFAQPVMRSEVVAVLHRVPGVVAVDVDLFHRWDAPATLQPWLEARLPRPDGAGGMLGAELLTLVAGPLDGLVVAT